MHKKIKMNLVTQKIMMMIYCIRKTKIQIYKVIREDLQIICNPICLVKA